MIAKQLKEYLDKHGIKYVSIQHSPAYAATDVAASAHVAARHFAKSVVVRIDGKPAIVVLPANRRLLVHDLREILESADVHLATEGELRALFPDCEVGAMPPFGNLYGFPVYVAPELAHEPEIAFNAGTHSEIVTLAFADFERLVRPHVVDFVTT